MENERHFKVMEKTVAARCEICHQPDLFDPMTETCLRCQALILTQNLPAEEAARFEERREQIAAARDKKLYISDLFRIMPEALKLYQKNFPLFFTIIAAIEVPLEILKLIPSALLQFNQINLVREPKLFFLLIALSLITSIVLPLFISPIAVGALTKGVLDRYRSESTSFIEVYKHILGRGWKFLSTIIISAFIPLLGGIGFALLLVPFLIFGLAGSTAALALTVLLGLLFTVIFAFFVLPRCFFIPEIAIVEDKYFSKAIKRSWQLGSENIWLIWLLTLIAATIGGIFGGSFALLGSIFNIISPKVGFFIGQILAIIAGTVVAPFGAATKLLLYFHYRMRTEDIIFPVDTGKKATLPSDEEPPVSTP